MLRLDEGDVVQDEQARLPDLLDLLHCPLGRLRAVAAPVEGPRAAEGAIPRAAAAELDRRARVELADIVLAPVAEQVARGQQIVEVLHEDGWRALPVERDRAGHLFERAPVVTRRLEQQDDRSLALPAQHAVERALAVAEELVRREGAAVAAGEDEAAGPALARRLGEVEDLGHIGEVVEGEGHRIGLPAVEQPEIVRLGLDLQVDQLDLVTGAPRRGGHELQPERLEAEIDLRVHQTAGMHGQKPHDVAVSFRSL